MGRILLSVHKNKMELMMILIFLTGAGVLDDVMDGLHMPLGNYV